MHYTLQAIREAGCTAGAAICPATPVEALADVAADALDMALCMSVNPGWGGQSFIPHSLDKLRRMRRLLPDDGRRSRSTAAIHEQTAGPCVRRAPTCSSPARPCSAPPTRRRDPYHARRR